MMGQITLEKNITSIDDKCDDLENAVLGLTGRHDGRTPEEEESVFLREGVATSQNRSQDDTENVLRTEENIGDNAQQELGLFLGDGRLFRREEELRQTKLLYYKNKCRRQSGSLFLAYIKHTSLGSPPVGRISRTKLKPHFQDFLSAFAICVPLACATTVVRDSDLPFFVLKWHDGRSDMEELQFLAGATVTRSSLFRIARERGDESQTENKKRLKKYHQQLTSTRSQRHSANKSNSIQNLNVNMEKQFCFAEDGDDAKMNSYTRKNKYHQQEGITLTRTSEEQQFLESEEQQQQFLESEEQLHYSLSSIGSSLNRQQIISSSIMTDNGQYNQQIDDNEQYNNNKYYVNWAQQLFNANATNFLELLRVTELGIDLKKIDTSSIPDDKSNSRKVVVPLVDHLYLLIIN